MSSRQRIPGSQAIPPSIRSTLRPGSRSKVPWTSEGDEVRHRAAGRAERVPLDVEGDRARPARRRGDAHPFSARVDRHREPELGRRLEDREVARLAVGPLGAAAEKHLDETWVLADPADLLGSLLRILGRAEDRLRAGARPARASASRIQSLWARASAAARYGLGMSETSTASSAFRTPASVPLGSRSSRCTASTFAPGGRPSAARSCRYHERRMRPRVAGEPESTGWARNQSRWAVSTCARNASGSPICGWMSQSIKGPSFSHVVARDRERPIPREDPLAVLADVEARLDMKGRRGRSSSSWSPRSSMLQSPRPMPEEARNATSAESGSPLDDRVDAVARVRRLEVGVDKPQRPAQIPVEDLLDATRREVAPQRAARRARAPFLRPRAEPSARARRTPAGRRLRRAETGTGSSRRPP